MNPVCPVFVTYSDVPEAPWEWSIDYFLFVRYHIYQLTPGEGFLSPSVAPNCTPGRPLSGMYTNWDQQIVKDFYIVFFKL